MIVDQNVQKTIPEKPQSPKFREILKKTSNVIGFNLAPQKLNEQNKTIENTEPVEQRLIRKEKKIIGFFLLNKKNLTEP